MAIEHADRILTWHENRPAKEIPPRWMWHLDHETSAWFDNLDEGDGDTESDGPMEDNDALPAHVRAAMNGD